MRWGVVSLSCVLGSASMFLLAGACGSFGTNEEDPPATPGGASAALDAAAEAHVTDDADSPADGGSGTETDATGLHREGGGAGGDLFTGGDFESTAGAIACTAWTPSSGSFSFAIVSNPVHGGGAACKICRSATAESNAVSFLSPPIKIPKDGSYTANAFVERAQGDSIGAALALVVGAGSDPVSASTILPAATWVSLSATRSVSSDDLVWANHEVRVRIDTVGLTQGCFFVDDVTLSESN